MRPTPAFTRDDGDDPPCPKGARTSRSTAETSSLSSVPPLSDMATGEGEEAMAHASARHDHEDDPYFEEFEEMGEQAGADIAEDILATTELSQSFQCNNCHKLHKTQTALEKHLAARKTNCYRERNGKWSCPRCRDKFTAKKGVLRHMQDTCWKICDECCAHGSKDCNAFYLPPGVACTNCSTSAQACSKHTAVVADCPPPQKVATGAGHHNTASPFASAPPKATMRHHRRGDRKRSASGSPENSPESKPQPKKRGRPSKRSIVAPEDDDNTSADEDLLASNRPAGIKKRGRPPKRSMAAPQEGRNLGFFDRDAIPDAAGPALPKRRGRPRKQPVIPSGDDDSLNGDLLGPDLPAPGQLGGRFHRPMSLARFESREREATPASRLPRDLAEGNASLPCVPIGSLSALTGMLRQPPLNGLPPMDGRDIQGIADGTRHAPAAQEQIERQKQFLARGQPTQYDRATQELLDRQRQSAQTIALMQQNMAVYSGSAFPAPVISSARSSLHMGQNSFDIIPPGRRSGLRGEIPIHEDHSRDHSNAAGYPPFGGSHPGSRVPSRAPSVVQGHFSAPGSRLSSRQPSPDHFDVHLSGIGSHFLTRAVSPVFRRSALSHDGLREIDMQDGNHVADESAETLAVSREVPPELNQDLSIPAALSEQPNDPSNPIIHLRISSNTYDPTGMLIFSILTIRIHDPFGPRLEYYCSQRNKRLNIDWKIIFKYAAPTPSDPKRKKYFDLNYDTTPNMCFDKEYPGARLQDGDTLLVCRRRTPADASEDNELGTQLDVERIEIENGERPVFQDQDVNVAWCRDIEEQLSSLKQQAATMQNVAQRYANEYSQSRNKEYTLGKENAYLKQKVMQQENELLRRQVSVLQGGHMQGGPVQPPSYAQMPEQFAQMGRVWQAPGQMQQHQQLQQDMRAVASGRHLPETPTPQQRGRSTVAQQGEGMDMLRANRSARTHDFAYDAQQQQMDGEGEEEE